MRIPELMVGSLLSVAVLAEGTYIIKTRRHMDALEQKVEQISAAEPRGGDPAGGSSAGAWQAGVRAAEAPAPGDSDEPGRAPPPRFVVSTKPVANANVNGDPLPMPPGFETPEAREQLRQFIAAQMAREKEEQRLQQEQRREEQQQARRNDMAKALGLSEADSKKFSDVLTSSQAARQALGDKMRGGQTSRDDIGKEFQALRQQQDDQLKAVLGDEGLKKFQGMQGGGRGGPGGGGGPGGPGGPGGGGRGFGGGFGGGGRGFGGGGQAPGGAGPGGPAGPPGN